MITNGKVIALNRNTEMYAIEKVTGGITIIELTSRFDIELGDIMSWTSGNSFGHCMYKNITSGESEEVYVQAHDVPKSNIKAHLGLA